MISLQQQLCPRHLS